MRGLFQPASSVGIDAEGTTEPHGGLWIDAFRRLRKNRVALVGLAIIGVFVLVGLVAPVLAPYGPKERVPGGLASSFFGPSAEYWFGTDGQGRDVFSRVVYGARISLLVGVVSVSVGVAGGSVWGAVAGYVGGWVESVLMRVVDVMLSIPGVLIAIGIVAAADRGFVQIMIAVGVTQMPIMARITRSAIIRLKTAEYVTAATIMGASRARTLATHLLPNALPPVLVQATLSLAVAIIDVAALGFLGLGPADPGVAEWGTMLTDATQNLTNAPHVVLFPALAVLVTSIGFNLLGDGLREALDPRLRR